MENHIFFTDKLAEYEQKQFPPHVLHVLCMRGSITFQYNDTRYLVVSHDLIILPEPSLVSDFTQSDNFQGLFMVLTENYTQTLAIRSNYGVIGALTLMLNPVMKLGDQDFAHCKEDMLHLRHRMNDEHNEFWKEMMGHLLMAHIVFLYNVSSRQTKTFDMNDRKAELLIQFFSLLYKGDYVRHRNLDYYADILCITPHYLTDICRKTTKHPATYWIDRFVVTEIMRRLSNKEVALSQIAHEMNFSSLSHFSRYVSKNLGQSPSYFRRTAGVS